MQAKATSTPAHQKARLKQHLEAQEPEQRRYCFTLQGQQIFQFEYRQVNCLLDTGNPQGKKKKKNPRVATSYIYNPAFDPKLLHMQITGVS